MSIPVRLDGQQQQYQDKVTDDKLKVAADKNNNRIDKLTASLVAPSKCEYLASSSIFV